MSGRAKSSALILALLAGAVGPLPGCGPGADAAPGTVLKDPPPLAKGDTTEELIRQQAKTRSKPKKADPRSNTRAR